jgi:hypothetical protein
MIYSEPERKGRLLALWQSIYQAATLIGGGINLGLNVHNKSSGGLAPKTYLTFVGLNCLAPFVSLLLSNPKQVQRVDKKPVPAFPCECGAGDWAAQGDVLIALQAPSCGASACSSPHTSAPMSRDVSGS